MHLQIIVLIITGIFFIYSGFGQKKDMGYELIVLAGAFCLAVAGILIHYTGW